MFIEKVETGYADDGSQYAGPGKFLVLIHSQDIEHLKAFVTDVLLTQIGHWMMGKIILPTTYEIILSGSYGQDGLAKRVSQEIYSSIGVALPQELYQAWATGGGHNTAGREAQQMRLWVTNNLRRLYVPNQIDLLAELREFLSEDN